MPACPSTDVERGAGSLTSRVSHERVVPLTLGPSPDGLSTSPFVFASLLLPVSGTGSSARNHLSTLTSQHLVREARLSTPTMLSGGFGLLLSLRSQWIFHLPQLSPALLRLAAPFQLGRIPQFRREDYARPAHPCLSPYASGTSGTPRAIFP